MKDNKFKQIIRDKLFIRSCICVLICIILTCLLSLSFIGKYEKQFIYVFGAITLFAFFRSVSKLLRKYSQEKDERFIGKISSKLSSFFTRLSEKFGIGKSKYLYGGDDEIIYGYNFKNEDKKEKQKKKKPIKWKNLEDNETKIRFLYVRYITAAMSFGYTFKTHHTPRTVKSLTSKNDVSDALFDLYESVRYSHVHPIINDADIEKLELCCIEAAQRKK